MQKIVRNARQQAIVKQLKQNYAIMQRCVILYRAHKIIVQLTMFSTVVKPSYVAADEV